MSDQRIFSQKWDKLYAAGVEYRPLNEIFLKQFLRKVREMAGALPKTAIDFGCGTGDSMIKLTKAGLKVTGIDYSAIALRKAKIKKVKARLICKDLETIGMEKDKKEVYDFLFCKLTIAFIKDKEKFLLSVKKMMGPKSVFCVITPVLHKGINYVIEDKPKIAVPYFEFLKLLKSSFKVVLEFHHDYPGERGDIATFLLMK